MSYEVEFGLPGLKQFEYVHVKVTGENLDVLRNEILAFNFIDNLMFIQSEHRRMADAIAERPAVVKQAMATQADVFKQAGPDLTAKQKENLIEQQLDAKVVEVTEKPWERKAPTNLNLFG